MFSQFTHQQPLADRLKYMVLITHPKPGDARPRVLRAISAFEGIGWYPVLFERAFNSNGGFSMQDNRLEHIGDVIDIDVLNLLEAYDQAVRDEEQPAAGGERLFSTVDAARYLEMRLDTFRYHAIRKRSIPSMRIGHDLVYRKSDLDSFASKPLTKVGRPRTKARFGD